MNNKPYYIISFLFISFTSIYAQKATVVFTTEKDSEVMIYEPIDGGYNNSISEKRLIASATHPATYEVQVSSHIFVHCKFPQLQKSCELILFPGDSLHVCLNSELIKFQGNNQEGLQYYYDNFTSIPFLEGYLKLSNIFEEYVAQEREMQTVIPALDDSLLISSHMEEIEKLPLTAHTTTAFSDVLKTDIYMHYNGFIIGWLWSILTDKKYEITAAKDSVKIKHQIESIFKQTTISRELIGYNHSGFYTSLYFRYFYREKDIPTGHEKETFGPYKRYLFAPENMQPVLLGSACITQLKYNSGEMDIPKMKKFFNEKFPQSEYTSILNEMISDENAPDSIANQFFIEEKIDSLKQLKNIQGLKGKTLFIDLWATWCMPCRAEFSNREQLDNLLNTYKDIATVYISVDNKKQEKAWLNCIKNYKLDGFHFIASDELVKDIKKHIYGIENLTIPRYVLIDPNGEILHKDLPRPSEITRLKEVLDSIIQQ